jgi:hypothetical protein
MESGQHHFRRLHHINDGLLAGLSEDASGAVERFAVSGVCYRLRAAASITAL